MAVDPIPLLLAIQYGYYFSNSERSYAKAFFPSPATKGGYTPRHRVTTAIEDIVKGK